jgi:hypothetical protein
MDKKKISKLYSDNLAVLLLQNNPIHTTRKGNYIIFLEVKDEKLFFSIPNHNNGSFYRKSIPIRLLENSLKKTKDDYKDLPFKDCRKSFFKAVCKIILTDKT